LSQKLEFVEISTLWSQTFSAKIDLKKLGSLILCMLVLTDDAWNDIMAEDTSTAGLK